MEFGCSGIWAHWYSYQQLSNTSGNMPPSSRQSQEAVDMVDGGSENSSKFRGRFLVGAGHTRRVFEQSCPEGRNQWCQRERQVTLESIDSGACELEILGTKKRVWRRFVLRLKHCVGGRRAEETSAGRSLRAYINLAAGRPPSFFSSSFQVLNM